MLMTLPLTQAKMESLLNPLETDTLIKWFNDNYLKLSTDKCHLLISKPNKDIHIKVEEESMNAVTLSINQESLWRSG